MDYVEAFISKPHAGSLYRPLVLIHCLKPISPSQLDEKNVLIEGGVRIKDIKAEWARQAAELKTKIENKDENTITKDLTEDERKTILGIESNPGNILVIRLNSAGDFSMYTLSLARTAR